MSDDSELERLINDQAADDKNGHRVYSTPLSDNFADGVVSPYKEIHRSLSTVNHGTLYAYIDLKCRCNICKAYMREYTAQWRKVRLKRGGFKHGTYGYQLGCRCNICVTAKTEYVASLIPDKPFSKCEED